MMLVRRLSDEEIALLEASARYPGQVEATTLLAVVLSLKQEREELHRVAKQRDELARQLAAAQQVEDALL